MSSIFGVQFFLPSDIKLIDVAMCDLEHNVKNINGLCFTATESGNFFSEI